ncbi:MAG: RnfH family protein [Pseudohongiellaceae bacterium]
MSSGRMILVEVAYALPEKQKIIAIRVPLGTTARQAVKQSGIDAEFPGLDITESPMGIFSRRLNGRDLPLPEEYVLQPRDRIEIYRPLIIDPNEARLARARKSR